MTQKAYEGYEIQVWAIADIGPKAGEWTKALFGFRDMNETAVDAARRLLVKRGAPKGLKFAVTTAAQSGVTVSSYGMESEWVNTYYGEA